jgi:glutamyl-Q tRNA(Asp) synthetase
VNPPSAAAPRPRYRGRFAPSPSGPLHFGSLVAALASCCDARAAGGEWLLRIEDVDTPRSRPGAEAQILATLERYGFEWDGAIVRQSDRIALYEEALAQLRTCGLVYVCECTRRELAATPVGPAGEHVYPGTCSSGLLSTRRERRQHAWRVRVDTKTRACQDRLQATQRQDLPNDVGDFVVKRADGLFAYQLAVVVDDGEQGITDVVRGADLLASTPRQVMLQYMLSLPTPKYLHVPIAINPAGAKLSKQTGAPALPAWPLPTLLAAWQFLEQPLPSESPMSVAEFWSWARASWHVARLPPVPMLPAPTVSPVVVPSAVVS